MNAQPDTRTVTGAEYANIRVSIAKFAEQAGIAPARAVKLRKAGAISDYTVSELARMGESKSVMRIAHTEEPIAVIRLGEPRVESATSRPIGYCASMTGQEVHEAARKWWTRDPRTLPVDAIHVTYAGFCVAALAFHGLDEVSGARFAYDTDLLANVVTLFSPGDSGVAEWEGRSALSATQEQAVSRVGRQLVTGGGGPVFYGHPEDL